MGHGGHLLGNWGYHSIRYPEEIPGGVLRTLASKFRRGCILRCTAVVVHTQNTNRPVRPRAAGAYRRLTPSTRAASPRGGRHRALPAHHKPCRAATGRAAPRPRRRASGAARAATPACRRATCAIHACLPACLSACLSIYLCVYGRPHVWGARARARGRAAHHPDDVSSSMQMEPPTVTWPVWKAKRGRMTRTKGGSWNGRRR